MKTLVVYATYSSGTQIAANIVSETLKKNNQEVTLKNASEVDPEEFRSFDLIIFGSPSWKQNGKQGQPHQYFLSLIQKLEGQTLANKNFAIFGLGHSDYYIPFAGAVDVIEEAVKKTGARLAVPSLRIDKFYFNQKENEKLLRDWIKKILGLI